MLKIKQYNETKVHFVPCPYCAKNVTFFNWSPVFCPNCTGELANYCKLVEEISERRIHYLKGLLWESGAY